MALIIDPDLLADSAADDNSTEVYINTTAKTIKLVANGDLSTDGVTLKCLYSFLKEEWRNDPNGKNLAAFPFPLTPITDESFEFGEGWDLADNTARYLIRTAGWTVKNTTGNTTQKWAGIVGLGTIEANDQLYFQQVLGGPAANVQLTGQINQAVQILSDPNGDGNYVDGYNRTGYFKLFCREYGQLYGVSSLTDIGVTTMDSIAYRFPISTGADLKIQANDAIVAFSVATSGGTWAANVATIDTLSAHGFSNGQFVRITGVTPSAWNVRGTVTTVDSNTFQISITSDPGTYSGNGTVKTIYNEIKVRYFDQNFSLDVDSATERDFGIVIDVGTHSGVDGVTTLAGSVLTTAEGGIDTEANLYVGGSLVIHEGNNASTYDISAVNSTAVTVTGNTFANALSNLSFTIYPPTNKAVPADAEDIYTKVQYLLRQDSDIDATDQSVTGKTADELLRFVGDTLKTRLVSVNPNLAGNNGVYIAGFLAADTNRITFVDNTGTERTYPFVAALTLNFGDNLKNDGSAKYWVYFSTLPGSNNDFGEAGALIVDDNAGIDISGNVGGLSAVVHTFNYEGNVQGGRTANTDAAVTAVAIGLSTGQYVRATGTIGRSVTNSLSLVAALERNYANP